VKNIYNIYGNDFFVCECFASPSELNAPPLCVNILTMCHLFDGRYENASTICENASTRHGMPASRLVKSPPPPLFFSKEPPRTQDATEYAGCRGFKVKRQLFDVIVSH
jgi:hypothetical protein